jgi:nucleoside-specific outer membrane channel protein Tsx
LVGNALAQAHIRAASRKRRTAPLYQYIGRIHVSVQPKVEIFQLHQHSSSLFGFKSGLPFSQLGNADLSLGPLNLKLVAQEYMILSKIPVIYAQSLPLSPDIDCSAPC